MSTITCHPIFGGYYMVFSCVISSYSLSYHYLDAHSTQKQEYGSPWKTASPCLDQNERNMVLLCWGVPKSSTLAVMSVLLFWSLWHGHDARSFLSFPGCCSWVLRAVSFARMLKNMQTRFLLGNVYIPPTFLAFYFFTMSLHFPGNFLIDQSTRGACGSSGVRVPKKKHSRSMWSGK